MPEVVPFRPLTQPLDMAQGLREQADRLEANEFPVAMQTCVVLMGATMLDGPVDESDSHKAWMIRYDFGPKQDAFTVVGMLAWAMAGMRKAGG